MTDTDAALEFIRKTFRETASHAAANAEDRVLQETLAKVAARCVETYRAGGRLITCGNGGSICDATHLAEELTGRYRDDRKALSAIPLNDPGHLTCAANDYGYEQVFARGVEAHARPGDVVIGFTTSGNSPNVLAAFRAARAAGAAAVGFLGKGGGAARGLCDHALVVGGATADRIQEQHIQLVHMLIELIERDLFPENYA